MSTSVPGPSDPRLSGPHLSGLPGPAAAPPVLLVTADPDLRAGVQRLAAAAGVGLEVHDVAAAPASWRAATIALLGADAVGRVAESSWPRRAEVVVVAHRVADPDPRLFRAALAAGARDVLVLPADDARLQDLLTDAADRPVGAGPGGRVIGFVAGSGGAGATTLAAAVAELAADDRPCLAVDLDPWGGGLDRVLGLEGEDGLRWDGLDGVQGRIGAGALRDAVPRRDDLGVLAWGPPSGLAALDAQRAEPTAGAIRTTLAAAVRGHPLVVLDLPRSTSAGVREAAARCDLVVVVGARTVSAAAATHRVATVFGQHARDLALVTRGRARGLRGEEIAAALGVPLVADLPEVRRLTEVVDLGGGPLRAGGRGVERVARAVLEHRGTAPATGAA